MTRCCVELKAIADVGAASALFASYQGKFEETLAPMAPLHLIGELPDQNHLEAMRQDPRVLGVDWDMDVTHDDVGVATIGVENYDQYSVVDSHLKMAHDAGFRGAGVLLGILDTGVRPTHVDLASSYKGGTNYLGSGEPIDDNGHGSHCNGISAGDANGQGSVGVAPDADVRHYKFLSAGGSGSWTNALEAMNQAVQDGCQVTSNSWSSSTSPGSTYENAFRLASEKLLIVCSAGNQNGGAQGFPAAWDFCLSVMSLNQGNSRSSFSSRGGDVTWYGSNILSAIHTHDTAFGTKSGTSMSCPGVAGAACLDIERGGDWRTFKDRLPEMCIDMGSPNDFGVGRFDFQKWLEGAAPVRGWLLTIHPFFETGTYPIVRSEYTMEGVVVPRMDDEPFDYRFKTDGPQQITGKAIDTEGGMANWEESFTLAELPPDSPPTGRFYVTGPDGAFVPPIPDPPPG